MFETNGHDVVPLGKKHFKLGIHDFKELFREADVLINLAGAPILKRWSSLYKKKLRSSRIDTAEKIHTAFKLLKDRPRLYIAASAVGIYSSNNQQHTETSNQYDSGFLGKLVTDWEQANLHFAELHNVRVVIMRFGIILSNQGGAFPQMSRPFKWGVGGRIGKGKQAFSFLHISDLLKVVDFFISTPKAEGIYNLSSPNPVTNRAFSKALGKALKRPSFMIVPSFVLRLIYGEASQIILRAPWAVPQKLQQEGFVFDYPSIEQALVELTTKKK